jgi:hypothetical protein
MLFKRLNRTDAERVFSVFKANAAGIAADDVVCLEVVAASVDGVNITGPVSTTDANNLNSCVGIADAAIANGAYGLVQIYGYRSTSRIVTTGTSLTAGLTVLMPVAAADYLQSAATVPLGYLPSFVLLQSQSSGAAAATVSSKIFIRCM